jgi:hypothetical protein
MSDLVNKWHEAKRARAQAEEWNYLPKGQSYSNSTFQISQAHSKAPVLVRHGQQVCGGTNYWETDKAFNDAILTHVVESWSGIYPHVLEVLIRREREALKACQAYVDEMQAAISEVGDRP